MNPWQGFECGLCSVRDRACDHYTEGTWFLTQRIERLTEQRDLMRSARRVQPRPRRNEGGPMIPDDELPYRADYAPEAKAHPASGAPACYCDSCHDVGRLWALIDIRRLTAERDRLRVELAGVRRELHRFQHGQEIEGDYVCEAMGENLALRDELASLREVVASNPPCERCAVAEAEVARLRGEDFYGEIETCERLRALVAELVEALRNGYSATEEADLLARANNALGGDS